MQRSKYGVCRNTVPCRRIYNARYKQAHPEQKADELRRHRAANPEQEALYAERRAVVQVQGHGLTLVQAREFKRGKPCEICGAVLSPKAMHVDHDHVTGKRRGVLCRLHNVMLGMAHDNPEELLGGIEYLAKYA